LMKDITITVPNEIPAVRTRASIASCAAGPGTAIRVSCGRRPATTTRRTIGATPSGSVAREDFPEISTSPERGGKATRPTMKLTLKDALRMQAQMRRRAWWS